MQKNQKFSKAELFQSVEKWQTSGLSQLHFSKREKLSVSTFNYWLRKYRKEKVLSKPFQKKFVKTFISVEVFKTIKPAILEVEQIKITYLNGVKVSCPVSINIHQLKSLINIL